MEERRERRKRKRESLLFGTVPPPSLPSPFPSSLSPPFLLRLGSIATVGLETGERKKERKGEEKGGLCPGTFENTHTFRFPPNFLARNPSKKDPGKVGQQNERIKRKLLYATRTLQLSRTAIPSRRSLRRRRWRKVGEMCWAGDSRRR